MIYLYMTPHLWHSRTKPAQANLANPIKLRNKSYTQDIHWEFVPVSIHHQQMCISFNSRNKVFDATSLSLSLSQ